jgi:hypothetical protein
MHRLPLTMLVAAMGLTLSGPVDAHDCKCRAMGVMFEQGQMACIMGKLAKCEMNENVPAWRKIADICPLAALPFSPHPQPVSSSLLR